MLQFLKECREELRKVAWPDREEVLNSTVVILIAVVIISILLFFMDSVFENLFNVFIDLFVE